MELEVPDSPLPCNDLRMRVLDLTEWLVEQRPVIGDGDTVSIGTSDKIRVNYAPSIIDRPGPVYRLIGL